MRFTSEVFGNGKGKYGLWSNISYCLREMWIFNKIYFFCCVLGFIPAVAAAFLKTYLPARVVADLEAGTMLGMLLLTLSVLSLVAWICNVADGMIQEYKHALIWSFIGHFQKKYIHKVMDIDYDKLESQDRQKVLGNVANSVSKGKGLSEINFFTYFIEYFVLVLLYGTLLSFANPLLTLAVLFTVFVDLRILAYARKKHAQYY